MNPSCWSQEHEQWQTCLKDPKAFCRNRTLEGSYETCERTTKGFFTFRCRDPYLWSRDYKDWRACRESPTDFCSQQNNETTICEFESHPKFGISLMIPYLFNYLISFLTWWRLEKKKKKTFVFPLINIYAQLGWWVCLGGWGDITGISNYCYLEAVKIVYLSLTDPTSAQQKKRRYQTEIALHEVFLEAVPATLVLIVLLTIALG